MQHFLKKQGENQTKNSSLYIQTYKQKQNMSGRGKGKSSKKAVSRSAKAGLQFPVGRIARCDYLCNLSIFYMRARIL